MGANSQQVLLAFRDAEACQELALILA